MEKKKENKRNKKINPYYDAFCHKKYEYDMLLCKSRQSQWE
ncbi:MULTISPECIES: hypothetical protein [Clostridium]|nr:MULTISPECIES: hypothetical protein [Clostridium]